MNEMKIFNSEEFGKVRVTMIEDDPMFCLSDVCKALGLTQPSKVKERLNEKGVNTIPTLTAGGEQKLLYISESNLYKTIFQSRKESAERFTEWVTSEVLPSIRKHEMYATDTALIYKLLTGTVSALARRGQVRNNKPPDGIEPPQMHQRQHKKPGKIPSPKIK